MRRCHKIQSIRRFYHLSKAACSAIEIMQIENVKSLKNLNAALSNLYAEALKLPEAHGNFPNAGKMRTYRDATRHYKICGYGQFFWVVFYPNNPDSLCQESFADALGEICGDLEDGNALYEAGDLKGALAIWRNSFYTHWGKHLVEIIHPLHVLITEDGSNMLSRE